MISAHWRTPTMVLICGALVLSISVGLRHGFGLWLQPMSMEHGWGREVFGFAIAVQNLVWGVSQPFIGILVDRVGAGRVALVGAVLYIIGLALMAHSHTPEMLVFSAGLLIGLGLACTTFGTIFAAVGRVMPPEKRSSALGIAGAVGSFGQFAMMPVEQGLISMFGWSGALIVMAGIAAFIIPLATPMLGDASGPKAGSDLSARDALREAFAHKGFVLLSAGYLVCGFHVTFIGTHLPAFLVDQKLSASVGTTVLALVGLVNIFGSYMAGRLGSHVRKPLLLSMLYFSRTIAILLFAFTPVTAWSAYAFGIVMGLSWLATVPLTSGTVASVFGVRNMSMLTGITFMFHQVGAFFGGWLGGRVYDLTGSYDIVWAIAAALGVVAALLNWPIKEEPVPRMAQVRTA